MESLGSSEEGWECCGWGILNSSFVIMSGAEGSEDCSSKKLRSGLSIYSVIEGFESPMPACCKTVDGDCAVGRSKKSKYVLSMCTLDGELGAPLPAYCAEFKLVLCGSRE